MDCRRCGTPLDRPGDYCLDCDTANADAVVVDVGTERATITVLDGDDEVVGTTHVTTTAETDAERVTVERRNFAGRIADEVRRRRPDAVYAAGDRELLRAIRETLRFDVYRIPADDPVAAARERRGERALDVVDAAPAEKIGGSHTTLIGDREGQRAVTTVAGHPHVKKVVPGPITAGGSSAGGGVRAKATRADENGNVRLLLRDGSSVQENRVVTTAMDRESGERVRADLEDALAEADLRE